MSITIKLALLALASAAITQGQSRFPPINLYNGDPTGNDCTTTPHLLLQSSTTGKLYSCQANHMALAGGPIPSLPGTQCVQTDGSGVLSTTGAPCPAGSANISG